MKKVSLLALAALSYFGTSFAEEYWVIKDGVLNENITQMEYERELSEDYDLTKTYDILTPEVEAPDGSIAASFLHAGVLYQDVRFDLTSAPIDLSKTWIVEVEYMLPASISDEGASLVDGKKPAFICGLYGTSPANIDVTKADAIFCIDGKFAPTDTWNVKKSYVYSNPTITTTEVLVLSYCREIGVELKYLQPESDDFDETVWEELVPMELAYIKNLRFISADCSSEPYCSKPFYAEDFNTANGKQVVHANNGNAAKLKATQLVGNIPFVSEEVMSLLRSWEDLGTDGSGYYDDEMYHALEVPMAHTPIYINGISIPVENDGNIYVSALVKQRYAKAEAGFPDATDEERVITAFAKFSDGTSVSLFHADSLLQGTWVEERNAIAIPAGATTVDIIFESSTYSYIVDNLQLGTNPESVNVDEISVDKGLDIVVYPNPASDVITVAGEVTKVEVVSLTGSVVASANGNQVNISALAAGSYLVKAYTAEGVGVKSIIKK